MKYFIQILLIISFCISCNPKTKNKNSVLDVKAGIQSDISYSQLIDDFRKFRDAVYHHDLPVTKVFFKFPISRIRK